MIQGRSPALDLDSLYGKGPNDPNSEVFYQADLLHLKAGGSDADPHDGFDLPRAGATPSSAVIPDPRNDENLAVAQTHLAFIRFHNRVVDTLPAGTPPAVAFMRARKVVTRHYQWMIKTDFLPRICDPAVVDDVFKNGRKAFEVGVPPRSSRRCRSSSRSPPTGSGTAWSGRRTTGTSTSTTARARSNCCSPSRARAATSAATSRSRPSGSPTSAGSTTSARPAGRISSCPRPSSTARCGSTRASCIRSRSCRRRRSGRRRCR